MKQSAKGTVYEDDEDKDGKDDNDSYSPSYKLDYYYKCEEEKKNEDSGFFFFILFIMFCMYLAQQAGGC